VETEQRHEDLGRTGQHKIIRIGVAKGARAYHRPALAEG
jgi:hypothetical protein